MICVGEGAEGLWNGEGIPPPRLERLGERRLAGSGVVPRPETNFAHLNVTLSHNASGGHFLKAFLTRISALLTAAAYGVTRSPIE